MRTRVFTTKNKDGKEWVLEFRPPNQGILNKADLIRKKVYSKCFREGYLTASEVEKVMRERGIWDDESEKKAAMLQLRIAKLEADLKKEETDDAEAKKICDELVTLRTELLAHNEPIVSIAENTCESISSEEQNQFLVTQCVYDKKTGLRVYKDVEDFKNRANEEAARDSYTEVVIASLEVVMGEELSSDLGQVYAENRWLRDHAEKMAEAKEEKPKTRKKKTRKKTSSKE